MWSWKNDKRFKHVKRATMSPSSVLHLLVSLQQLVSLHEVLVFELLFEQLVLLLQMALFQLPHGSLPCCLRTHKHTQKMITIMTHFKTFFYSAFLHGMQWTETRARDTQQQLWAEVTSLGANSWMLQMLMSAIVNFANEVSALNCLTISTPSESSLQAPKAQLQAPWLGSVNISEKCCLCSSWHAEHGIKSQAVLTANRLLTAVGGGWSERISCCLQQRACLLLIWLAIAEIMFNAVTC